MCSLFYAPGKMQNFTIMKGNKVVAESANICTSWQYKMLINLIQYRKMGFTTQIYKPISRTVFFI